WDKNIPRADISLQPHSAVCKLHFDERNIERHFPEVRVEGDVVRMKLTIPLLAPDAVPTVFPNLPKYLTKKTPQKCKDRSGGESQFAKCARRSNPTHAESTSVPDFSPAPAEPVSNLRKDCCDGVVVLSSRWIKPPFPECTVFADVHLGPSKSALLADKLMVITEASPATVEEKLICTLLLKGSTHKEVQLTTATELQKFLNDTDRSELCIGAGVSEEFLPLQAGREHIVEAWQCDSSSLKLRAMPRITHTHLFPNAFENMRVNLAFHLFSEEVERGLHLYQEQIQQARGNHQGTLQLHKHISTLIRVMTSRCPYDALRPGSEQAKFIDDFLAYLDEWERGAKDGGFVSQSTAEGLRVTLQSTKSLLRYLVTLGYRYMMTARLSQDCIERLFGIIRQSLGPNDHPTVAQFLILFNCLSFYNLAKSPAGGSISKGVLNSMLSAEDAGKTARDQLDALLEAGKLDKVEEVLIEDDHASCFEDTSDSRLVYYMAGYAARKCITKRGGCGDCKAACLRESTPRAADHAASYMRLFDRGGLLYATDGLFGLISHLENVFTRCFSTRKLQANCIVDSLSCIGGNVPGVRCDEHKMELTNSITRFYLITRLHFYVKQTSCEMS
ncbi:uncharacterized protein ISCGN_008501, partial [Ixodes scapularis]